MLLAGSTAPKFEPPAPPTDPWDDMSWWQKALDILSRPNYASAAAAKSLITGQGNPLQEAWRGLKGEKRTTYSDVLAATGMDKGPLRSVVGFGLDVGLDPTTYLTFGTGGGAKVAVKGVQKTLTPAAAAARSATKLHLEGRLLEILPKLDEARRSTLLERTGLSLAGKELPNEALAKAMAERLTNDALGRAAAGGPVPKQMSTLKGLKEEEIFQPAALRFAGHEVAKGSTLAAPVKAGYGLAKKIPGVGKAIQGAEHVAVTAGAALKKVFSTKSGLPEFDEIVTGARDKLDRDTFNVFERRSKQWIEPLKAIRKEGGEEAYQSAMKEIRTFLEGTEQIKKTPLFDASKIAEVDQHIAKLTEHLEATRKLHGESAARRGAQAGKIGQLIAGAEAKLGKLGGSSSVEEIRKFFGAKPSADPGRLKILKKTQQALDDLAKKHADDIRVGQYLKAKDLDRAAARAADAFWDELPADVKEFLERRSMRDWETGETLNVMEHGVRGTTVHDIREELFHLSREAASAGPGREAEFLAKKLAKDENRIRGAARASFEGELAKEFRARGIAPNKSGVMGEEYAANIPRHFRKKGGVPADEFIQELSRRGILPANATEEDFYRLLRQVTAKPKKARPEDMLELAQGQVAAENAWKAKKLEDRIKALKEKQAGLQGASPLLEAQVKKLEAELAEQQTLRKQIPTMMRETPEMIRVAPVDPRAAAVAESMRATFEDIWKAEKQHLALPPEKLDFYFPHYMRDEVRSMLIDVMRMDARKVMKPERSAALAESLHRSTYGTVDEITVSHLIDTGALDPSKVREELAARGVHLSTDDMLVFEENPIVAAVKRELNHVRSMVHTEFARQVLESPYFLKGKIAFSDTYRIRQTLSQHPGHVLLVPTKEYIEKFATPQMRAEMQAGRHKEIVQSLFKEVDINDLNRLAKDEVLKNVQAYIIPREVAEHLARAYTLQFNEKELKEAFQIWDKMTGWWKAFATVWRPGFHARNAFSNFWNMFLGGWRDPKSMFEAGMILNKPESVERIAGYTGREILALADSFGVRKSGFIGTDIAEAVERVVQPSANPLSVTGPVARLGSKVGSTIEDHARLTFFIDGLKQGMDPAAAAMRVKKYLFDYKDLTRIEKGFFRRMLPFYTWTRKNIPLQLEILFTRPGVVSALEKVRTNAERGQDDPLERKFVADWIRESFGIPVRRTADGKTEYFLLKGWVPTADLMSFGLDDVVASLHPAIKSPIEVAVNKNFFTGRPLELFPGEKHKFVGVPLRGKLVQLLRNITFMSQLDRMLFQPDNLEPAAAALNFGLGIRTYAQDKVVQMRSHVFELQGHLGSLQTAAAAARKKYGEDSSVFLQYQAEILETMAERDRVKADLLEIAPDAFRPTKTAMLDRLLKPKKERVTLPSVAGMKRRLRPNLQRILYPPKRKEPRGA